MKPYLFWLLTFGIVGCGEFLPASMEDDAGSDPDVRGIDVRGSLVDGGSDASGGDAATGALDGDAEAAAPYVYVPSGGAAFFTDDFERADSTDVGNGWTESAGGGFSIVSGDVQLFSFGTAFRPVVYRPSSAADVEVSAAFTFAGSIDETTLYARLQPEEPGKMGAYSAWVAPSKIEIDLTYKTVGGFGKVTLGQRAILPTLLVGKSYRIYLRVSGTNAVTVEAGVFDGTTEIVSVRGTDSSANRILAPGAIGFGSFEVQQTLWQEFELR